MTEALSRLRASAVDRSALRTTGTGALLAGWAAGTGLAAVLVPVLLAWAADPRSGAGAGDAGRTAGALWLLAHRVPLGLGAARLSVAPLGLTVLLVVLLYRAGVAVADRCRPTDLRAAGAAVAAVAAPYALLAALVAVAAHTPAAGASPVTAGLTGFGWAVAGAGAAVVRRQRLVPTLAPADLRRAAPATAAAAAALGAGAAVVLAAALLAHASTVAALARALRPGVVGSVALLLLDVAYLPNALVAAAGYSSGAGFHIGSAGLFAPLGGHPPTAIPALPLLGALPGPHAGPLALLTFLVPVGAGLAAAAVTLRRCPDRPARVAGLAAAAGGLLFPVLLALGLLAGGSAGAGRLTTVGVTAPLVAALLAAQVAAVAALGAASARWRGWR